MGYTAQNAIRTFKFRYNLIGYRKGEDGQPEIVLEEAKYVRRLRYVFRWNSVDQIKEYLGSAPIKQRRAMIFGVEMLFVIF
ncbi:MAG: hypothetical protein ACLU3R_06430 [Acutalibacteraceae bacterium]